MDIQSFVDLREKLGSIIDNINLLIAGKNYLEAEEHLDSAEQLFRQLVSIANPNLDTHSRVIEYRRIDLNYLASQIASGLERREAGKKQDGNLAFKCNWNDRGYKGLCSEEAYEYNSIFGGPWCVRSHGKCREYVNAEIVPSDCCYEARALIDCKFAAGWDHDGYGRMIRPRKILSAKRGKIALLTTRRPNTDETARLVVGAFPIISVHDDPGEETWILGNSELTLDDMLKYEIRFWDHYINPNNPNALAWATGLFRYVGDVTVFGILEDYLAKKIANRENTAVVDQLIDMLKK
jgi:hypothetical protein